MLFAFFLIVALVLVPVWGVTCYLKWFSRYELPQVNESHFPRAAVILAVRGASPSLEDCLSRLVNQDYPRYQVFVVVDHPSDPASEVIQQWSTRHPEAPLEISYLNNPSSKAYLKTSAVLQCIRTLEDDFGAIVLADADTLSYSRWLRDLVLPLMSDEVGLVTGNRWYDPTCVSLGGLVQFFYNSLCVPPMYFMGATWGGSLAIKRAVFQTRTFNEGSIESFSEEVIFQKATFIAGLRLEIQPNVMILNRETSTLASAFNFMKRQLLWTRLYHSAWMLLLVGNWVVNLCLTGFSIVGIYGLTVGNGILAFTLLGGLVLEIASCQLLSEWLHRAIARRALRVQGTSYPAIDWPTRCRMMMVIPLAYVLFSYAMLAAAFARKVTWSGITYEVIPPANIRMKKYLPINETTETI
ncbi:glycosyltransferase [Bythopirellula polymerisocia]|uniref:N-glycosyltransferase n=1 Tax=Bythopirellula polymerisocia TaxID=2528003 RepID=A0A5C6CN80_9BACT|nr:glycosyltransferase family 2 protein [Bythopirellula polymerisocia]TWU25882.1 N-glycosyltransferase [Bythopirellula polymerisocia]